MTQFFPIWTFEPIFAAHKIVEEPIMT